MRAPVFGQTLFGRQTRGGRHRLLAVRRSAATAKPRGRDQGLSGLVHPHQKRSREELVSVAEFCGPHGAPVEGDSLPAGEIHHPQTVGGQHKAEVHRGDARVLEAEFAAGRTPRQRDQSGDGRFAPLASTSTGEKRDLDLRDRSVLTRVWVERTEAGRRVPGPLAEVRRVNEPHLVGTDARWFRPARTNRPCAARQTTESARGSSN